jgi:hypothetical protein
MGSHGGESDPESGSGLTPRQVELLAELARLISPDRVAALQELFPEMKFEDELSVYRAPDAEQERGAGQEGDDA